jgi:hypothetical protein
VPGAAEILTNYAGLLCEFRDFTGSRSLLEQVVEIREAHAKSDVLEIIRTLSNLGGVEYLLKDYAASHSHFARAMEMSKASLDAGHPLIATVRGNLQDVERASKGKDGPVSDPLR